MKRKRAFSIIAIVIAVLVFVLIVKRLPSSKLWRHLVLHDSTTTESGYVSAETRAELVGCTGRAETELRPSGRAVVAGQPVDVVLHHPNGSQERIKALHSYTPQQIAWFRAGSALNTLSKQ